LVDLLELLGIIDYKKKKKQEKQLISSETDESTQKKDASEEVTQQSGSICAGCNRILEIGAVYESGKSWCTECYKTHVLKIKAEE
jgi:hypothetical protein